MGSAKSMKDWNPTAKTCSKCEYLEPIVDKKTGTADLTKKYCRKWQWEITNRMAKREPVCKLSFTEQKRMRRGKKA